MEEEYIHESQKKRLALIRAGWGKDGSDKVKISGAFVNGI